MAVIWRRRTETLTPSPRSSHMRLLRQVVVAVAWHDPTLLARLRDGQLCGALGAFGEGHDLLAELVIAHLPSQIRQSLSDVRSIDLAPDESRSGNGSGRREPQRVGIEFEQAGRLGGRG